LDSNFPNNIAVFSKSYSNKNSYDAFNILNRKLPQKQYYITVVPDYVTVTYDFVISTYYMEQMNGILEAINYASDSYWGDPEKFKFKANIDSFVTNTELSTDVERVVKSTFSVRLHGYIIPEIIQKDLASIKKIYDKVQINFSTETVSNINDIK
jgi:predicted PilT family ATPase